MSKLTKKQIDFIEHLYSYGDSDDELDSPGILGFDGVPDMAGIMIFWQDEPAWSIPIMVKKGYLKMDETNHEILFNSWKNVCDQLEVDVAKEFNSFDEFQKKYREIY